MRRALKLTTDEFIERASKLNLRDGFDFAINCCYLDKDLDKATEDDLTDWYGIKKISEFDQEIILIGCYGGDESYAISYKWDRDPNEFFEFDLRDVISKIAVHTHEFAGIYVFEEV